MTLTPGELPKLDAPESQGLSKDRLALIDTYLQYVYCTGSQYLLAYLFTVLTYAYCFRIFFLFEY